MSLARASRKMKITELTLKKYENGSAMRINMAKKISDATGIPVRELNVTCEMKEELAQARMENEKNPIVFDETTIENWFALLYVVDRIKNYRWKKIMHY